MSFALALLLAIGTTTICAAKSFVYVSNAQDGNCPPSAPLRQRGVFT